MKKLLTQRRWKDHIRRRQLAEARRKRTRGPAYRPPGTPKGYASLEVPEHFSLIKNPNDVCLFLTDMRRLAQRFHINLDLSQVRSITTDAVAALAATMLALPGTNVRGNHPTNVQADRVFEDSGFFDHVQSTTPLPKALRGKMKKRQSKRVEPKTAVELIDCGNSQAFGKACKSPSTRAAYTTLIEAMGNTHNHAAGESESRESWWAGVYGDSTRGRVCYTFLDTGVGIFRSVKLSTLKKLYRSVGIESNLDILRDILEGHVESRTGLSYRGKGLPAIFKKSKAGHLKALVIVSNDVMANIETNDFKLLSTSFKGTLLYWECEE